MNLLRSPAVWFVVGGIAIAATIAVVTIAAFKRRNPALWGFKDVVKDPGHWERVSQAHDETEAAVEAASEWDDAQVAHAVREFVLDASSSRDAWAELRVLKAVGKRTHSSVLELLRNDELYPRLVMPTGDNLGPEAPFNRACELLSDAPPPEAVEALAPFLDDASESIRKDAALTIAETGAATIGPHVRKAFSDADDYVRSYALMGLKRAIDRSVLAESMSHELFPDVLAQLREGKNAGEAADILFCLDEERAKEFFLSPQTFTADSPILHNLLKTLANAKVPASPERIRELIASLESMELRYPRQYALEEALRLLGQQQRADDRDFLWARENHPQEEIARGAASGLLSSYGLEGFEQKIWEIENRSGYEALSEPQRLYSAVFMCDAEVNNGGFAQYFVNSSGDHWRDAVAGLEAMGSTQRLGILKEAIAQFGSDGPSTDRSTRQAELSKLFKRNDCIFEELESRYYKSSEVVESLTGKYVLANPDGFR